MSTGAVGADSVLSGRYRLVEHLAAGGMGTVWRGVDLLLDREVAIKEVRLPPGLDDEARETLRRRTIREAQAAARLRHPAIVTVFDVVEQDDRPWIVMEYVAAPSLGRVIRDRGPLPPVKVAAIALRVLDAMVTAQAAGVQHRDIKPANILLDDTGRVVLTDFGIARHVGDETLTSAGLLVGSPDYLAPERARGLPTPGLAADLWSLGATMYHAVEGVLPFDRDGALPTLAAVVMDEPPPPKLAGPLRPIIDGLLVKDPAHRLDADRTRAMLQRVIRGRPSGSTQPYDPPDRTTLEGAVLPRTGAGQPEPTLATPTRADVPAPEPTTAIEPAAVPAPTPAPTPQPTPQPIPQPIPQPRRKPTWRPTRRTKTATAGTAAGAAAATAAAGAAAAPDTDPTAAGPAGSAPPSTPDTPAEPAVTPDPPATPAPTAAEPATTRRTAEPAPAAEPPRTGRTAATGPTAAPARVPVAEPDRTADRPRRRTAVAALLTLAVAAAAALTVPRLLDDDDPTPPRSAPTSAAAPTTPPATTPAAAPTSAASPSAASTTPAPTTTRPSPTASRTPPPANPTGAAVPVPAGFTRYTDPGEGFSVIAPIGWRPSRDGRQVDFEDPSSSRFLRIETSDTPLADPLQNWIDYERTFRGRPGYTNLGIRRVAYRGWNTADWEFTIGSTHVLDRNIRVNDARAHALYWSTPQSLWNTAESRRILALAEQSFVPAPVAR
jgi:eukaryotic-like serine/threonine-protein kinase